MKIKLNNKPFPTLVLFGVLILASCNPDKEEIVPVVPSVDNTQKQAVVDTYATIVYASYEDAVTEAENLRTAVVSFISAPTNAGLDAARQAYINAREPYGQTDAYRFYDGPIDNAEGKEGLMNGWPMDELFIDYVDSNSTSGIINNPVDYPIISASTIEGLNEFGGETNIASGYHAIEFLLWGQDLSDNGAGQRSYTDYMTNGSGTNLNQQRRGQYLLAAVDLLIENLQYTKNAWEPGADNFRKTFENQDPNVSLKQMITGIGKFCKGELFGERMLVALNTQDQEDEHSCFSDQTHRDFQLGITGIENVYNGTYTRIDGTVIDGKGLNELIATTNSAANDATINAIAATKTAVFSIQAPFDQEILNVEGKLRVQSALSNGFILADKIVAGATTIGITIAL